MVGESETSIPPVGRKRLPRSRRQIFIQVAAAAVILACGVVIGSGAALLYLKDDIVRNPGPPPGVMVREMQARYGLTQEQAAKTKAAFEASWERMREFFVEMKEERDAEFKRLSSDLKEILTPTQFERWQRDIQSMRRPRPSRFGPGRPGPGGRPGGPGGGRSGTFRSDPNGRRGPDGWKPGPGGGRSGRRGPDRGGFDTRPRDPAEPNSGAEDDSQIH